MPPGMSAAEESVQEYTVPQGRGCVPHNYGQGESKTSLVIGKMLGMISQCS